MEAPRAVLKTSRSLAALVSLSGASGAEALEGGGYAGNGSSAAPPPPSSWDPALVAWQPQEMRAVRARRASPDALLPTLLGEAPSAAPAAKARGRSRGSLRTVHCIATGCDMVMDDQSDYCRRNKLVRWSRRAPLLAAAGSALFNCSHPPTLPPSPTSHAPQCLTHLRALEVTHRGATKVRYSPS